MALGKNLKKAKEKEASIDAGDEKKELTDTAVLEDEEDKVPSDDGTGADVEETSTIEQFCVFKSGNEEYAIGINLVKEVVQYPVVSPVPQMPDYIRGMANVRGNIYGILDIAAFFKVPNDQEPKYLLVLDMDEYQMGVAIPEVPDNMVVADDSIESLSSSRLKSTVGQKYLRGIIKKDRRMIILFDILGMISSDKFTARS